jgi:hypothetical protein
MKGSLMTVAACVATMFAGGVQAGPLLPNLQTGVAQLGGAVSTAVPGAALAGNGGALSGLAGSGSLPTFAAAALPGLDAVSPKAEGDWLDYNLNYWPTEVSGWASMRVTYAQYGSGLVLDRALQGPVEEPYCYDCTAVSPYTSYARDLLGLGNGALGLVVGPVPPLPQRPDGLPWWVEANLDFYPDDVLYWAGGRRGEVVFHTDNVLREASVSGGNPLGALQDGALGLVVGPLPPLPQLPTSY